MKNFRVSVISRTVWRLLQIIGWGKGMSVALTVPLKKMGCSVNPLMIHCPLFSYCIRAILDIKSWLMKLAMIIQTGDSNWICWVVSWLLIVLKKQYCSVLSDLDFGRWQEIQYIKVCIKRTNIVCKCLPAILSSCTETIQFYLYSFKLWNLNLNVSFFFFFFLEQFTE